MLRPVSFSIPSSTELRIVFNKPISASLGKENFAVEAVSGNVDGLEVRRVETFDNYVVVTVSPQVAGSFYVLHLKDTLDQKFLAKDGSILVNDDVSRDLFFVGIKKHNPIRDKMFFNVPKTYDLENSNIEKILSSQSEELFKAQKDLGQILSNNYISEEVIDERRVRSSGATDRLVNEGVYEITRVSSTPNQDNLVFRNIEYSFDSDIDRHKEVPSYPISLQEVYEKEEEISLRTADNSFEGFLLKLSKNNIIKVTSIILVKPDDVEDCYGNIGTEYSIGLFKYSISDNKYDEESAFKNIDLNSNEVLLSPFGNIQKPRLEDKIIVSYLYKDHSVNVNEDSVEVYNLKEVSSESVPSNITRFFLKNAPIVDSNNDVPEQGGVSFFTSSGKSEAFKTELKFNSSKLPSELGEYSVNYTTGEVIVAGGSEVGRGTGSDPITARYIYRNNFTRNLDFYIKDNDLVPSDSRLFIGESVSIDFSYESVYVEGIDYKADCHKEVLNEHVESNFESSFVIRPVNTPVTNVNRIYNQTTGEIYPLLYHTEDEIYFTGKRSPEIKTQSNEPARFIRAEEPEVYPNGEFICPAFEVEIRSNASNSSISFFPGIPAELIERNSLNYFVRSLGLLDGDVVTDIPVKFFGEPDSNNLINTLALPSQVVPPSLGEVVSVGTRVFSFKLSNDLILSKDLDSVGFYLNSSVDLFGSERFKREKYFENSVGEKRLEDTQDKISKLVSEEESEIFKRNMSRLRKVGDYSIDYNLGVIYLAVTSDDKYDPIKLAYHHGSIDNLNKNVLSLTGGFKKLSSADGDIKSNVIYDNLFSDSTNSRILDLESSLTERKNGLIAPDEDGRNQEVCVLLDDYTVVAPYLITGVRGVYEPSLLKGEALSARSSESRIEDLGSDVAPLNVSEGGANLYDSSLMSYRERVIDLKSQKTSRAISDAEGLRVRVDDSSFGSVYEVIYNSTGELLFDEKLNIDKISGLDIVNTFMLSEDEVYADIRSGVDLSEINDEDFLLDSSGRRFEVISADPVLSRILLRSPAQNNVEAAEPAIGSAKIIVKASVNIDEEGADILIPSDTVVKAGDTLRVVYVQSFVPSPGSELALDCAYGDLYISYLYVKDDVYISYEYGDNEIDWSISKTINEGDEYFVSYKYGASRSALRDNFGILTKIPLFQRFPLEFDREVYRNGLKGVMSAFSNGAIKSSFETIVESFTDIKPNIHESFFGNWILGRDHITPQRIDVKGPLEFRTCKFNEGVYIEGDTVISTPAISNLNLSEGTFSAWVSPDWSGIDNDATITIDLDNLGVDEYRYRLGNDIFDFESNFSVFSTEYATGGVDHNGASITLHNFTNVWIDDSKSEEEVQIAAYAIRKDDSILNRSVASEHNVSLKVSSFSAPENINPPRTRASEDIARNLVTLGLSGLGKSLSDASRGLHGGARELESIRFCSPAFMSLGDEDRLFLSLFSMIPVINDNNGKIYTFRVGNEHITKNEIPKYDRSHITRNCFCSVNDTLTELSSFRDKDFQTIKVELDFNIDISYISKKEVILDSGSSIFRILDTTGSIYEVYALIGDDGEVYSNSIPDKIKGFFVNRFPENKEFVSSKGSEEINNTLPVGEITLLYQTVSILTNEAEDSQTYLGYQLKNHTLDWMSDYVNFKIVRNPQENKLDFVIDNPERTNERAINLFYTDLIYTWQESEVFYELNLDKWFNVVDGVEEFSELSYLSRGLSIGTLDQTTASVIDINEISRTIYNRYSLEDVYVGSAGFSPNRTPFSINKSDIINPSVGMPLNSDSKEGLFIGFDNTCEPLIPESSGQWIMRARTSDSIMLPSKVLGETEDGYLFEYETVLVPSSFSGTIITDGEFSSVTKSNKKEDGFGCPTDLGCSAKFRFCGTELLDPDGGWVKLEETDSSLINTLLGGSEGQKSRWMKHGAFSTFADNGIYRMGESSASVDSETHLVEDGNFVYTRLPCYSGDYEATVGFRVPAFDIGNFRKTGLGRFSGVISGTLTGISPIHLYDESVNIKVALAVSDYDFPLIVILNGDTNEVLDISYFDWDGSRESHLTIEKDSTADMFTISSNGSILSRISKEEVLSSGVNQCGLLNEPFFAIHLFDSALSDIESFHQDGLGNILDITLIEYSGESAPAESSFEDNDILISTDSKITFKFNNGYDYRVISSEKGVLDGYTDGYAEEIGYDIDEICFTSDKLRYLLDTGVSESNGRFSIFKDGKGFLNFRIIDSPKDNKGSTEFNIATNIKHFKPGELHHIAASWRLNTLYERDEMHLFVDGLEAPSLFRFGGQARLRLNDKYSDVSKEILQDFLEDNIEYGEMFDDGTILAGTSRFISKSANFTDDMVGRSILFVNSSIATSYIGKEYIINSVDGDQVTFVRGTNLELVKFDASASDISFKFPPTAGLSKSISTDLKNNSFEIYREDCDGNVEELGGIKYFIENGIIKIVSGEDVINPAYRVNIDTRIIEFVGTDKECNFTESVKYSDLNVHIKTFGLKLALFKEKINLSSSSYFGADNVPNDPYSGKSVFLSHAAEPVFLEDVKIRRIVLDRMIPEVELDFSGDNIVANFDVTLDKDVSTHRLSSEPGSITKENRGRYLSINFDSDNTIFCLEEQDSDGYAPDDSFSHIVVYGETADGSGSELFRITENGITRGSKIFLSVDRIEGSIAVIDPDYEMFVIQLIEADTIDQQNNAGDYAEIFRYSNGSFILSSAGSNGVYPFELHAGNYDVRYPCHLKVNIPRVGDTLYIGCDISEDNQFGGIVDEVRVITEMSSDTRPTQRITDGTRSVTKDFLDPNPFCADDQTLLLSHFDNPIAYQSRKLRQKEFLDKKDNFKYKLDLEDREQLLEVVNDKARFESKMLRMGFDKEIAERVFTEVYHAEGGPIHNEAKLNRSDKMLVSSTSVNDSFGLSARFMDTPPLIIDNRLSYFRKDAGSIELWVSPILDTWDDISERVYLDIYSIAKKRVKSFSPGIINLPSAAKKILKIELLQDSSEFSEFMSAEDLDRAFLDNVYRSKVTGRLTGGTGVGKDFSLSSHLSPDGKTVFLEEALPGHSVDVVVSYIPRDFSGDRIRLFKGSDSSLTFEILSGGRKLSVSRAIDWKRNTWHRIFCSYKANSDDDNIKMFVDGVDSDALKYGADGLLYGSGPLYGQETEYDKGVKKSRIDIRDDFKLISIGADVFGDNSALSRMDNIRFSRVARSMPQTPSGEFVDIDFSENISTATPVIKDDLTTLVINFERNSSKDTYATIVDPVSGVFDFDVEVLDYFSKIDSEIVEDLIVQLIDRLKPAHTNAVVIFPRERC